jgi:PAS domain S-box-containing protein
MIMNDGLNDLALIEKMQNAFAYHKIVTDENGQPIDYEYIYINAAFEELTGLKRDIILGKKVTELIPEIDKRNFDLIKYYGNIALNGIEGKIVQYFDI